MLEALDDWESLPSTVVLDIVGQCLYIWHALWFCHSGHGKCLLEVVAVVVTGCHMGHYLHLIASHGHTMAGIQGLLHHAWKVWEAILHTGLENAPFPPSGAHLLEHCGWLALCECFYGHGSIAHGHELLVFCAGIVENSFAKLAKVAGPQ